MDPASERARSLVVNMNRMVMFDPGEVAPLYRWLRGLSIPWCDRSALLEAAPALPGLAGLKDYFA